ncbi:MAG TPA: energy transducer TonB [Sphingobacterium sp.]|nr:energy transducer TonB [Sphingobacterium sp.]
MCFITFFIYITNGNAHENYKPLSRDSVSNPVQENNEGFQAFRQWVQKNYKLPKAAKKARVYGRVNVSFVVWEDGRLDDFEILEDVGYGTGEEFIRVLRQAKKWSPGIQDGKPVRVKYTLPMFIDTRRR